MDFAKFLTRTCNESSSNYHLHTELIQIEFSVGSQFVVEEIGGTREDRKGGDSGTCVNDLSKQRNGPEWIYDNHHQFFGS